jgi:hypothetical protein
MLVPLSAIVKITITYTAFMSLERRATTLTLFPELSVLFYPGLAPFLLGYPHLGAADRSDFATRSGPPP